MAAKPHVFDMREFDSMMKRHRKEGVMTGSIVDQEQFVGRLGLSVDRLAVFHLRCAVRNMIATR